MSEHIVKIIPKDPFYIVSEPTLQSVKTFLETRIHCDFIEVEFNETPVFVDCGANLEKISCPQCGAELDFDWWGNVMDEVADNSFTALEATTPCCKKQISLNDLNYNFPCGFACCLISIYNPEQIVDDKIIDELQNIYGIGVRIIEAHL